MSPYESPLLGIGAEQQRQGNQASNELLYGSGGRGGSVLNFYQDLLAGTDPYSAGLRWNRDQFLGGPVEDANKTGGIAPALKAFYETAADPRQDELTRYFRQQYDQSTNANLARYGLLGQGPGSRVQNDAARAWDMNTLQTADARRAAATQNATALTQAQQAMITAPYAFQQAGATGVPATYGTALGFSRAGSDIYSQLQASDQQRRAAQVQLSQAAATPWETFLNSAGAISSVFANSIGKGKGYTPMSTSGPVGGPLIGGTGYGGGYGAGYGYAQNNQGTVPGYMQMPQSGLSSPYGMNYTSYPGSGNPYQGLGSSVSSPYEATSWNWGGGPGARSQPIVFG